MFNNMILVCHGRTASYLTAPAQIPACGTTALGSSEILASVKDKSFIFFCLLYYSLQESLHLFLQSYLPGECSLYRLRILSSPSSCIEYHELIRIPISRQSPSALICFTRLYNSHSGSTVFLMAYLIPCVRFILLLPISMQHSVRVVG
jgi:hypothetical protein